MKQPSVCKLVLKLEMVQTYIILKYFKRFTFGCVQFLAPLAVEYLRQIKYIAKCALIKT